LWLDASDETTISDTAGAVDQWDDKSGNDNHATASTTTRPTTGATSQNGLNTLSFDGVANTLTIANDAAFNGSALTYFIVAKQSAAANESLFYKASATSGVNGFIFRFRTGTTVWLYQANDNAGATLSTATNTNTDMAIYAVTLAASSQGGFVSGARQASATVSATYEDTGAIWIGSRRNIGEYLSGDVAEVIVFDTALSTADRARVESYLASKWGISGVHAPATATSDPVGYWRDKSGNNRHATQATAGSRPLVGTQNGRKALTFDGSNDRLGTYTSALQPSSIFAVAKCTSSGAFPSGRTILGSDTSNQPLAWIEAGRWEFVRWGQNMSGPDRKSVV
jgi:hypothetical protein